MGQPALLELDHPGPEPQDVRLSQIVQQEAKLDVGRSRHKVGAEAALKALPGAEFPDTIPEHLVYQAVARYHERGIVQALPSPCSWRHVHVVSPVSPDSSRAAIAERSHRPDTADQARPAASAEVDAAPGSWSQTGQRHHPAHRHRQALLQERPPRSQPGPQGVQPASSSWHQEGSRLGEQHAGIA